MTVEDPAEGFLSEEDLDRRTRLLARVQGRGEATPLHEHLGREAASLLSVSSSALIVMSGKEVGTVVAASEDGGVALEDLQFTLGEGPCLEAYRTSSPVLVPDLQADGFQRWPMFADAASRAGAGAVFAIPLQLGAIRMGVLYLTRSTPAPLSGEDLSNAFVLADLCTLSLRGGATPEGVRIEVTDQGLGLPPGVDIFEPFRQAEEGEAKGVGFGLHIVRTLLEAMDGSVTARPNPDRGATFTVLLPRAP